jgi:hypothetical protein
VFPVSYVCHLHIKSKAIPVTRRGGLYGCEMLRMPHCLDNRLIDDCEVISLTRRSRSTGQKHSFLLWYPFLLECESSSGPSVAH